ncbi:peptidase U32 family protein [Pelobacter propionicus]|uniref:Peptidase U32 n=1 Tax=Pelobacter propionicus (strain DSM 2379 / NBRC 103807 / OttBd1) TaxID=338966 RepID=A1ALE3_PELPD|nr:U32 family peptidase [Pelobacter propionicus]ABK98163.1 peptidase U32 [Pelobacter propionicus DSM 2379]
MQRPELLAPAGNMEKLRTAVHYGADAVYLGGRAFGLRNLADNFSIHEMAAALEFCHEREVRAYLTVNSYPHNDALERLERYLSEVAELPFDAYIVADPGVMELAREISPRRELHLSTQANTINWRSARFWRSQGISRVNLARETTLEAMAETVAKSGLDVEVFVHGALCVSYSGRCLLSSAMAGRDANQGECAHPCRWNYHLVEEKRPGEFFPVHEDESGTFIFNSRDLCLLEHLPAIVSSGVASLKIEGRMKGINYVASVLRVYRQALDEYAADPLGYRCRPEWLEELSKLSHRGYTTGFLFGAPRDVGQEYTSAYLRSHEFVGLVEALREDGSVVVGVRNRINVGDELEFVGPGMRSHRLRLDGLLLLDPEGGTQDGDVANPNQRVIMHPPFSVGPFDLIRREKTSMP